MKKLLDKWYHERSYHDDSELLRQTVIFMNERAEHLNPNKSFNMLIHEYLKQYFKQV